MKTEVIKIRHRAAASAYEVLVTGSGLAGLGDQAVKCLGKTAKKIVVVSNPTVFALYGKDVQRSLKSAGFDVSDWLMKDGERFKNSRSLNDALAHFSDVRLSRDDAVVALGGGVVGDLAGFATAIYLRGIRFLQVPTTLLAMIDSSVGGKTGINTNAGKNLVGAFHRPAGVLIDVETLETLPRRELTPGFCEAVKQAAISGRKLFAETGAYLSEFPPESGLGDRERAVSLIAHQVAFKASIVAGDETEQTGRNDARSRKILNFGHTFGHALEKVTNYRRFRHGEAVGYGLLAAGQLSKNLDLFSQNELELLNDVVHRAGRLPNIRDVSPEQIFQAIKFDKKTTASILNWVLLRGIGKPVIVPESDIPGSALTNAVETILKKYTK